MEEEGGVRDVWKIWVVEIIADLEGKKKDYMSINVKEVQRFNIEEEGLYGH